MTVPTKDGTSPRRLAVGARAAGVFAVLVCAALWFAPGAFAANSLYWGTYSGETISHANLSGGGAADLTITGATPDEPLGTAIDAATGTIYWANYGNGTISYANLNGSGGGILTTTGATLSDPWGLAIDPPAGKLYWANYGSSTISYANLNGSGGGELTTTGATVNGPSGVAVDPTTGRIYWTNYGGPSIGYANLDDSGGGGNLTTAGATITEPAGLAIDTATGRVYWTNYSGSNTIGYANLDGSGGGTLTITGVTPSQPIGLAIDPIAGKIYWANYDSSTLASANLDGSGASSFTTTGANTDGSDYPVLLEVPSGTAAPTATGGPLAPSALNCSQGSWAGDLLESFLYRVPQSFAYQWSANGTAIPGATSATYAASAPGQYTCTVTATNAAGSTPQTSAPLTLAYPRLTVTATGSGQGTLTSIPAGIDCGATCSAAYPTGTAVVLTATPAHGSAFAGWSGACTGTSTCAVTMTGSLAAVATFTKIPPPNTKITKAKISSAKHTAAFTFKAIGTATGFQCALVKKAKPHHRKPKPSFKSCRSVKGYKHLKAGSYTFLVRAVGPGGTDSTPASKGFKIS